MRRGWARRREWGGRGVRDGGDEMKGRRDNVRKGWKVKGC